MSEKKRKLVQLVQQVDPDLIDRCRTDGEVKLSRLFESLVQQHVESKTNPQSSPPLSINQQTTTATHPHHLTIAENEESSADDFHPEHDPLTGLPNRNYFREHVEFAIKKSTRSEKPFALIFIDIDHFKAINDSHSHQVGDQLLKQIAKRVSLAIRKSDVLCRLAGDEFCLLVEELESPDAIIRVIESIRERLSHPFELNDVSILVTTSVGVSIFPDDGQHFEELLHHADLAMYESKRSGRNAVSIFKPEISEKLKRLHRQQKQLGSAIEFQRLEFWMQPELRLADAEVCAVRQIGSLPSPGLESEAALLETAKRSKKVSVLNLEFLRHACQTKQYWNNRFVMSPRVVVPLYRDLFHSPRCAHLIRDAILQHQLQGSELEFEIEESHLMDHNEAGIDVLKNIHQLGCQVSLINFGIDPSSLKLLSSGFVDKIKIDRTLIKEIENNKQSRLLLDAIIGLSKKFNIRTVALDVFSAKQIRLLTDLGCDGIRGDYLSQPLTVQGFETVLKNIDKQNSLSLDFWQERKRQIKSGIPPQR